MIQTNISPRISEEVLKIAPRWRSLQVRASKPIPASILRRLAEEKLDSLEELELGTIEQDIIDLGNKTVLFFSTAPRLRKLRMSIYSNAPQILMPWAQLNDLTLDCHLPDIALDILAQCANLIKASVRTSTR